MYFAFFDNTFSAIVSLVTAVFGLSYPLLIESIQKIDFKYKSIRIKRRFEESDTYKSYNGLLVISVFVAIFMPFLLATVIKHAAIGYILLTIQMALLLLLIIMTIRLVKQIQLYNDPEELMDEILRNATKSDYMVVLDIMNYVSASFPEVYRKGMSWIMQMIIQENLNYANK